MIDFNVIDFKDLALRFDEPAVASIALLGSHARGDAGDESDIDLLRLVKDAATVTHPPGSYLIHDRLVVISDQPLGEIDKIFERPELATTQVAGLRDGRPLVDRDNTFQRLQERARDFQWDHTLQERANHYASREMVGWAEEVHKAWSGLNRHDIGRILNARLGLTWGMTDVMRVQRGILLRGDNGVYGEINQAMGVESEWVRLRKIAFGIAPYRTDQGDVPGNDQANLLATPAPSLEQQLIAGLQLYVLTAEMLDDIFQQQHRSLILHTVQQTKQKLERHLSLRKSV